ncbi:hypothetical protein T05_7939 [Trichinella murrelli]|uniref:Uncharacterized protein n=1 Tax=Trichinella murrelli TaxID=144512 RepID=A0A0V0U2B9_9BILA|nr:hypothetical protein T05_7939 [Trichinella murrelli]
MLKFWPEKKNEKRNGGKNPQSEQHSAVAFLVGQLGEGQRIRAQQPLGSPNVRGHAGQFVNVCQQWVLIENPQISKKKVGCPPACPVPGRQSQLAYFPILKKHLRSLVRRIPMHFQFGKLSPLNCSRYCLIV